MPADRKHIVCTTTKPSVKGCTSLFDNIFSAHRPMFSLSEKVWTPPADMYETRNSVIIKMEVAGVCLDSLDISTEGNTLTVQGCRQEIAPQPKESYHLMEICYGHFERVFRLPQKMNTNDVTAQYSCGFLIVTIARTPEQKNNKIEIEIIEE